MNQNHTIISDPLHVAGNLESMALSEEAIREAIEQAYLLRTRLTDHHPRLYHGLFMWGEIVSALRDRLRTSGWIKDTTDNYETTIHEKNSLAISVAAGDEATGKQMSTPSNKSKKGQNTIAAIDNNNQEDMFKELLPKNAQTGYRLTTWILLHHVSDEEIRIELSCPRTIDSDGKIRSWKERIILKPIPLDSDPTPLSDDTSQEADIDIEIKRRA